MYSCCLGEQDSGIGSLQNPISLMVLQRKGNISLQRSPL